MANYLLKYGSYTLPDTFAVEKWPMNRNVPSSTLPRADGTRTILGYLEGKTWSIKGALVSGGQTIPTSTLDLRSQLDALRAKLEAGYSTFQTHDDRFFRLCQVSNYQEQFSETAFDHWAEISFDIVTGDPFAYEFTQQSVSQAITATGQTFNLTVGGNAYALPQFAVTISTGGTLNATITNTATADVFTLKGSVSAGDVLLVNSFTKRVTRRADGQSVYGLFDGLLPNLVMGNNTIVVQYGAGATISNVAVDWKNRWW